MGTAPQTWQPRSIVRYIKSFASGASTVFVETDQGEGYLKALGNAAGPHALACEWVGTNLASLLGLPTFQFAQIDVLAEDVIPLATGKNALPGPAFITRAEKGGPWGGTIKELRRLANPVSLNRLVLLDTWTLNCDRHRAEPKRVHVDNVFLSREGAPKRRLVLKAMDHTHCFTSGRALGRELTNIDYVQDDRIYGLFPKFRDFLQEEAMVDAVADMRKIARSEVERIVRTIPDPWEVEGEVRAALVELILRRRDFVAERIVRKIWHAGEIEFPNSR